MLVLKQYRCFPYRGTWGSQIEISSSLAKAWKPKYSLCDEEKLSFLWILLDLLRIISDPFIYLKIYLHCKESSWQIEPKSVP